jgi:hypothetical protein
MATKNNAENVLSAVSFDTSTDSRRWPLILQFFHSSDRSLHDIERGWVCEDILPQDWFEMYALDIWYVLSDRPMEDVKLARGFQVNFIPLRFMATGGGARAV